MPTLAQIALALGGSWVSGINLYLTAFALGLLQRLGWIALPGDLSILASDIVLIVSGVMTLVELVVDKIPAVDSMWDTIHTFIRIPAGAVIAYAAMGHEVDTEMLVLAVLAGGTLAGTAHGAKATTRAAANLSPEPFSNWILSIGEDLGVLGVLAVAVTHPIIAIWLVGCLAVASVVLMIFLAAFLKAAFGRLIRWWRVLNGYFAPAQWSKTS